MKKLKYIFLDEKIIEIDLIDNEFVNKWLEYFSTTISQKNLNFEIKSHSLGIINSNESEYFITLIDELKASLNFISLFLNIKFKIYNQDIGKNLNSYKKRMLDSSIIPIIDRNLLNYIHRIFTTLIDNRCVLIDNVNRRNKELMENIHVLNKNVHLLESKFENTYPDRRNQFKHKLIYEITCTTAGDIDIPDDLWSNVGMIKDKFDPLKESSDYSVWLNEDILGKDMIRAWLDYDDIRQHDITGNLFYTPNIVLDPYKNYHKILKSEDWIKYYNQTHKTLDRFPIGNISFMSIGDNEVVSLSQIYIDGKLIYNKL